ncbi:hypothetical protein [Nostoc sp.]|uniref:hypothetical protein n=1 Tax=Nostoc sp. TaxID=1180 RepID=UPI002FF25FD9
MLSSFVTVFADVDRPGVGCSALLYAFPDHRYSLKLVLLYYFFVVTAAASASSLAAIASKVAFSASSMVAIARKVAVAAWFSALSARC